VPVVGARPGWGGFLQPIANDEAPLRQLQRQNYPVKFFLHKLSALKYGTKNAPLFARRFDTNSPPVHKVHASIPGAVSPKWAAEVPSLCRPIPRRPQHQESDLSVPKKLNETATKTPFVCDACITRIVEELRDRQEFFAEFVGEADDEFEVAMVQLLNSAANTIISLQNERDAANPIGGLN
jgi:hypothetical protein